MRATLLAVFHMSGQQARKRLPRLGKAKKKYHFKIKKEDLFPQNSRDKKFRGRKIPEWKKEGLLQLMLQQLLF